MEVVDVTVRPPWPSEPPRSSGPGGLVRIDGGVARRALRARMITFIRERLARQIIKQNGTADDLAWSRTLAFFKQNLG